MAGDIDFFGYQRAKTGTYLLSSEYASVYFSNSPGGNDVSAQKAGLVQNANVAYQHNIQPRFEAGSSEMYWLTGQSMGTVSVGRVVGDKGILDGIRHGNSPGDLRKGILGAVEFKLGRIQMAGIFTKQEVIIMNGCVLEGVGFGFGVGGFDVSESLTIRVALMKRATA